MEYLLLPPATKLGQGYIFTGIYDSVRGGAWSGGGGLLRGVPGPRGYLVPEGVPAPVGSHPRGGQLLGEGEGVPGPGGAWWRPPRDGYCCGRYASYWNAFLLSINVLINGILGYKSLKKHKGFLVIILLYDDAYKKIAGNSQGLLLW